jgi:hypothetical protein
MVLKRLKMKNLQQGQGRKNQDANELCTKCEQENMEITEVLQATIHHQ